MDKQQRLANDTLRDLITEIRVSRRNLDALGRQTISYQAAQSERSYYVDTVRRFRACWLNRHTPRFDAYGDMRPNHAEMQERTK